MVQATRLATAPTQHKKTHLEHNPREQAAHIAQRHAVHKRPARMHAPAYWCLNFLRALSAKGHREGVHQGASLSVADIRTRAHTQTWRRQPPAENDELLAKQACSQRSDARSNKSRVLVFWPQHGKIDIADARGEARRHAPLVHTLALLLAQWEWRRDAATANARSRNEDVPKERGAA